jgi:hypothetical protein
MFLRLRILACIATLLVFAGCSQPAQQDITEVREPTIKREAPPKTTTEQRLGMAANGGGAAATGEGDPLAGITFHHDMPQGWEAVPKTDMRQVNLRMKDTPEAECYFTLLPGGGGGLEANLNRWRGQMGLEPLSPEAIAALPKKTIFGQPATFILIDGTFAGMGDIAPRENYRMYGVMLSHKDPESGREQGFFLKMTGPKAVLENQEANFDLVASSLHAVAPGEEHSHDHGADDGHAHSEGDGHDHGTEAPAAEATAPAMEKTAPASSGEGSGYTWAVPAGWENKEPGMMRQANLTITGQPDVECYLTELSGSAGGLESNINRWQQQMEQPALTPDQIAALPKQPLLDGQATYVIIDGTFGGMGGTVLKENYRMYGLALVNDTVSHFVKMTGPKDLLVAEEANFLAFAASLSKGAAAAPAPEAAPMPEAAPAPQAAADNPHGVADPTPDGGFNPANIQWTAPEGWEQAPEKMMRVVTYTVGGVECYVTSLAGEAGGAVSNINRWANQMGQAPLDEAAIAALPKLNLLAQEVPLVEFAGDFVDMDGAPKPGYKLLGTLASASGTTIFIKLTGPASEVDAQKDKFIAFCASLH